MYKPVNCRVNAADAQVDLVATGRRLRYYRLRSNLTQDALSEIISNGCEHSASKNAISAWENGRKLLSLKHAVFLSRLYSCPIDELVLCVGRSSQIDERDPARPLWILIDGHMQKAYVRLFLCVNRWCVGNSVIFPYDGINKRRSATTLPRTIVERRTK